MNKKISRFLVQSDNISNINANVLASDIAPQEFIIKPNAGEKYSITRLIIYIKDDGNLDAEKYGNNITLINGITLEQRKNGSVYWDVNSQKPILTNAGWKTLCHDEALSSYGVGNNSVTYRYTFEKEGGPLILDGNTNDEFAVILKDDFTGTIEHLFRVGGELIATP